MRPCTETVPLVGSRMRVISLRQVLLPVPLEPMMPKASPRSTERLTSRRAQNTSLRRSPCWRRNAFRASSWKERARSCRRLKHLAT